MSTKAIIFINYIIVIIVCINLTFNAIAEIIESHNVIDIIWSIIIALIVLFYGSRNVLHVVDKLERLNKKD